MKAKELYPNKEEFYDYQPIINSFGNILIQIDDVDYSGDSRILYQKDGKYGYLIFGWGSCSGCDALQACDNYDDVDELIESLKNNIKWYSSLQELQEYFKTKDWGLEYSCNQGETKEFIDKVLKFKQ